ncbi:anti-phage ZorAB system protein ZorA [uncultured Sphingomonas sp.]|uniref:anti-phage ZorAB system protein ZorA n=1 Tax=uncultured Sphingomonas sp. TaxID=158754 RepID=UPI0026149D3A|nr:anti-phage ZorAB system protein ZorA [uncultured Sphingomonas sp.]
MDRILDVILWALGLVYRERWVAPLVLLPIMFGIAGWIHLQAWRKTKPYLKAARARVDALKSALGGDSDPVVERAAFADAFGRVGGAMNAEGQGAHELVQAWREFQETIIDETSSPIRNTNRPNVFFQRAAPRQTTLTFASNIFVAAGLILTFLGLIVALNTAAGGMSGGDVQAAQLSLVGLLTVAGAKFFTSVAGLGASIWLRFAEHGLARRVRHETELLCQLLERGLLYVPPQRYAAEQLEVMKEQRDQLKFFNTDVAMQLSDRIGKQFEQAIAPVAHSLSTLNDNMVSVTQGIGAGAKEAIEKVSGDQLRGLSDTLATLSQRLDVVSQSVAGSSQDASNQIRLAGADFAKAATDIRDAFETLTGRVDNMGARLSEQGEAAQRAQEQSLAGMVAGIEAAQARTSEMVAGIVASLQHAGAEAATTMQREVGQALADGVAESQRTFRVAVEESAEGLKGTANDLTRAIGQAAETVERAGQGFSRSGDNAARAAVAMGEVADNGRSVAVSINDAAKGFSNAAAPVAGAAQAVNAAVDRLATTIETDRRADDAAIAEMRTLAETMRQTHAAADVAWREYRGRFEEVDRALAATTGKLAETLGDSFAEFRRFAQDTDRELASAVSRLSGTLTQVQEYAEALDEYVNEMRAPHAEAAE